MGPETCLNNNYHVFLADGQSMITEGSYTWTVTEVTRSEKTRERTVTTEEMFLGELIHERKRESSRNRHVYRWRLALPGVPDPPPVELPVSPYLLGIWLGDGDSSSGRMTTGTGDLPHFLTRLTDLGERYTVSEDKRKDGRVHFIYILGLRTRLRIAGFLNNKHIPDTYLSGSLGQRRELLAGLLDTDGTVSAHQVTITMVRPLLMESILVLVRSLGYRATLREFRASLNGRDAGPMYRIQFAAAGTSPFSLARKNAAIVRLKPGRSQYNAVTSIQALA